MTGALATGLDEILSSAVLGQDIACACGRTHQVVTRQVVIESDVADRAPDLLPGLTAGQRVLLVADRRTWEAAGARLEAALRRSYAVDSCIVPDPARGHILASAKLVDELDAAHRTDYDLLAAVGSGTINDLTKELAHRRQRPYFVLATAASMNGYTSSIVALLDRGLKITRPAAPPVAFRTAASLASAFSWTLARPTASDITLFTA